MAEKSKISERDATLVNILDRMAGQLQRQELLLEEIVKRQDDFSKAMDNAKFSQGSLRSENDTAFKRLYDALTRYRSDMLSLVNEQDRINERMAELHKVLNKTAYTLEIADQRLSDFYERVKIQEKAVHDHYEHSLKQAGMIPQKFADTDRNVAKLHADTEKRLGEMHRETQRQLEKLQQETSRRLLALDSIEDALRTLLIRTEPPEKRPFFMIRFVKKVGGLLKIKLPLALKRVLLRRNKKK